MKSIISPAGVFGGFSQVNILDDRYVTDSGEYQFSVIGSPHSIGDWIAPEAIPIVVVPQSVTRRQARQALRLAGVIDSILPALSAIPDPLQRDLAIIEWEDSQSFERHRPLVVTMGAALGLDLDALFIEAGKL